MALQKHLCVHVEYQTWPPNWGGTVEENLAQQHRPGHQTGGNGGGKPGRTTQIWPPKWGKPGRTTQIWPPNWGKTWPNNTDLATKLGGNGEGKPGRTTQIWPPNWGGTGEENLAQQHRSGHQTGGERWRKTWPNNTDLATKLGGNGGGPLQDCPVCVVI